MKSSISYGAKLAVRFKLLRIIKCGISSTFCLWFPVSFWTAGVNMSRYSDTCTYNHTHKHNKTEQTPISLNTAFSAFGPTYSSDNAGDGLTRRPTPPRTSPLPHNVHHQAQEPPQRNARSDTLHRQLNPDWHHYTRQLYLHSWKTTWNYIQHSLHTLHQLTSFGHQRRNMHPCYIGPL